jgi:hypothetical protein
VTGRGRRVLGVSTSLDTRGGERVLERFDLNVVRRRFDALYRQVSRR